MLKVLELFAGLGACSKAMERLGIEHEIVDAVEIDKYAIKSFNAIHGTNFEPQDITKWDKDIECDFILHGSPCQDFSVAGLNKGGDKGSGTRSSLMYETLRIVEKLKPKYVIWENVKNLLSKKHRHNFDAYLDAMDKLGYKSKYKVLNAKDFGVPQNRERVFTVSVRKDLEAEFMAFEFPEPIPLEKRLKDILEPVVEEKFYIESTRLAAIKKWEQRQKDNGRGFRFELKDGGSIGRAITTSGDRPASTNYIRVANATKKGYDIATDGDSINLQFPNSATRRGRVGHGVSQTLQASDMMGTLDNYRIRKLTPKECWRLMGFDDEDFNKAEKVCSRTQLYKQAGNSIVVNVLEGILRNLLLNQ